MSLVKVTMVTARGAICHLLCELLLDSKNKWSARYYIDHEVLLERFDLIWSFCRDQCCSCTSSAECYKATGSKVFHICDEFANIHLNRQIQATNFGSNHFWYKISDWNGSACSVEMQVQLLKNPCAGCLINRRRDHLLFLVDALHVVMNWIYLQCLVWVPLEMERKQP